MAKDATKSAIEYIKTLQKDLLSQEDMLGSALPYHCNEVISTMEKHMEKQISNLKKQLEEVSLFLDTCAERAMTKKMIADLDGMLSVVKELKHADSQFVNDEREDPLGKYLHFHDVPARSYYAVINDYTTIRANIAAFVNAKLNEQEQTNEDLK